MSNFYEVPNLLEQFQASLIKERVGIIEFAESPKYLGRRLYPRQKTLLKIIFLEELDDYDKSVIKEWQIGREGGGEVDIVPKLEWRMQYLRDNGYLHFRTVQLVGGRRSSKGYLSGIIIAYKAYLLTLYDDMHRELNIPSGKEIFFPIIADSLAQAKEHQFADASDAIIDCKQLQLQRLLGRSLQETVTIHTPSDLRRAAALRSQGVKVDRDMASIVIKAHGTNSKTLRGSASLMFIFDEMAHLVAGESRMSDTQLWQAAIPSLAQFRQMGMILANSSPYQKTGQFYKLWEQANKLDPEEDVYDEDGKLVVEAKPAFPDHIAIQFPSWELYKDWEQFGMSPPQVDDPVRDPILAAEERADPDTFKVEYRSQWAEVMDAFLRPEMVDRAFDPAFNEEVLGRVLVPNMSAVAFTRYKGHGDPAAVGPANFGIAVGHIEEVTNPDNGFVEQHVVFDLLDAFYPADFENNTIDWLEVVPEITSIINAFRPFEWTFDQFDSRQAVQQLQVELKNQAIDTNVYIKPGTQKLNDQRWKNFRAALNLGRIHAPHPDTFNPLATRNSIELARNELKYLIDKGGKVDHQTIGPVKTKDIADCMAEVVDALIGDSLTPTMAGMSTSPALGHGLGSRPGHSSGNTEAFPELTGWYTNVGPVRGLQGHDPARGRKRH